MAGVCFGRIFQSLWLRMFIASSVGLLSLFCKKNISAHPLSPGAGFSVSCLWVHWCWFSILAVGFVPGSWFLVLGLWFQILSLTAWQT